MNPIYITDIAPDGRLLVGGIFKMKDQVGFPLDCSYDICKENNLAIDYCELLCDAWLTNCLGFDAVCRELELLGGSHVEEWKTAGAVFTSFHPECLDAENPVDEFCKYILDVKRKSSESFNGFVSELKRFKANLNEANC
jgi:hypothetical protein